MGQPFSKPKHQSSSSLVIAESKKPSDSKGIAIIDKTKINATNAALVMAEVNARCNLVNIDCLKPLSLDLIAIILSYTYPYNIVCYDFITFTGSANLGMFKPSEEFITECQQAKKIALNHILTAGPLDALEEEAKQNPNALLRPIRLTMTLDGIDFIFEGSPLQLAIMLLDQTVTQAKNSTVLMTDEGQAERLMRVIEDCECMRGRIPEAQEQARAAAPFDDKETSKAEEEKESEVFKNAFTAIKANNLEAARNIIWNYIISIKPVVITDRQYFLKLFRLIPRALNFLVAQYEKSKKEKKDEWNWSQAAQFCIKAIGTIERLLPHKLRKVLISGLYEMLYRGRNINRSLDVSDASYLSVGALELAVNCFLDDAGHGRRVCWQVFSPPWVAWAVHVFSAYISNYISAAEVMVRSNTHQKSDALIPHLVEAHRPI